MNCPRCKTAIERLNDPDGVVTCPGCGARLMTRSAALRSGATRVPLAPSASGATIAPRQPSSLAAQLSPSATLPPTPVAQITPVPKRPSTPMPAFRRTAALAGAAQASPKATAAATTADADGSAKTLDLILDELRSLHTAQDELRELLQRALAGGLASRGSSADGDDDSITATPTRARRQKSVLLIDDDPQTREAALAAFGTAGVPARAYDDGSAALSAIAEEKPDTIVLELGLGGDMAGKDVINMIKATMEWVDIPLVLWTREPVSNQKEARQIHGADELVLKSAGAAALVNRVIAVFRRG